MITKMSSLPFCSRPLPLFLHSFLPNRTFSRASSIVKQQQDILTKHKSIKPKLDPSRKQVTDFLKQTPHYEEDVQDVTAPYYFESGKRLKGYATAEGTDLY